PVVGESASYCLRITHKSAAVLRIPSDREHIEDLVNKYLTAVRSRQPEDNAASELFSLLLRQAVGESLPKRLIIVPDRGLHLLPFDALKDETGKYILESSIVTYAPSATVLHLLRQ